MQFVVPGGVVAIRHEVERQLSVDDTRITTVILAPGATVTLLPPFKVTELIARESVNVVWAVKPDVRPMAVSRNATLRSLS
jgi:hypothetical protein